MARALAERRFPRRFYTASAGVAPGERDSFVDAVLAEVGIDLGFHRPAALDDLPDLNFDLVITLAPIAHHHLLELTRGQATPVEYWATSDPTLAHGSREQILSAYRNLRDRLALRVEERLGALAG